jgi:hypothetical protein
MSPSSIAEVLVPIMRCFSPRELFMTTKTNRIAIVFTKVNVVGGFDQISVIIRQTSQLGFSHNTLLRHLIRRVSIVVCLPQPLKKHTKTLKGSSFTNYSVTDLFSTNYFKWTVITNFDQHEIQYIKKIQIYELLFINYIKKDVAIFLTLEWNFPVYELYHLSQSELGYYGKYISQNKSSGYLYYVIPSKSYDIQLEEYMNISENDIRLKKLDKKGSILSNTYRNIHYKLTISLEDIKNKSEMEQILQIQIYSKVKKNIENLTLPLNLSVAIILSWPKAKSVIWVSKSYFYL